MTITKADGKHIHHDLIVEWAKDPTRRVQFMGPYEEWKDCNSQPCWAPNLSYRFKPEVVIISCRRALVKSFYNAKRPYALVNVYDETEEKVYENDSNFIKWVSDRVVSTFEI